MSIYSYCAKDAIHTVLKITAVDTIYTTPSITENKQRNKILTFLPFGIVYHKVTNLVQIQTVDPQGQGLDMLSDSARTGVNAERSDETWL